MPIRRVVTEMGPDGVPRIASDGPVPPAVVLATVPGYELSELFVAERVPPSPDEAVTEGRPWKLMPEVGEVAWRVVVRPPDRDTGSDASAIVAAVVGEEWHGPGEDADGEAEGGMHVTSSIDLVTVVSGEVYLTVGSSEVRLQPGDCVVQNQTPHAWHNRGTVPCVAVAFTIPVPNGEA